MQLLKITSLPIQYRYEIENARLENQKPELPSYNMAHRPSSLEVNSKNIQVRLNTDAMFASMGFRTPGAAARESADRGTRLAQQGMGNSVQFGNDMARIDDGVTIAQIMKSRFSGNIPSTVHTFIPSVGPEIGWEPEQIQMSYDPGSLEFDWETSRNAMTYVPGRFALEITQYPKVDIEYLGGINYVPPSADPNYEGAEE